MRNNSINQLPNPEFRVRGNESLIRTFILQQNDGARTLEEISAQIDPGIDLATHGEQHIVQDRPIPPETAVSGSSDLALRVHNQEVAYLATLQARRKLEAAYDDTYLQPTPQPAFVPINTGNLQDLQGVADARSKVDLATTRPEPYPYSSPVVQPQQPLPPATTFFRPTPPNTTNAGNY